MRSVKPVLAIFRLDRVSQTESRIILQIYVLFFVVPIEIYTKAMSCSNVGVKCQIAVIKSYQILLYLNFTFF